MSDQLGTRDLLMTLGTMLYRQGDSPSAWALLEESLVISWELGDRSGLAHTLSTLGKVAAARQDPVTARALHHTSLTSFR
jgi:uncharacterized protein HemY